MAAESLVETLCRVFVERKHRGRLMKWVSPGSSGVPDRLLLIPNLPVVFVEFKAPGGILSPKQEQWALWLRGSGFEHWVISNVDDFKRKVGEYCGKSTNAQT